MSKQIVSDSKLFQFEASWQDLTSLLSFRDEECRLFAAFRSTVASRLHPFAFGCSCCFCFAEARCIQTLQDIARSRRVVDRYTAWKAWLSISKLVIVQLLKRQKDMYFINLYQANHIVLGVMFENGLQWQTPEMCISWLWLTLIHSTLKTEITIFRDQLGLLLLASTFWT